MPNRHTRLKTGKALKPVLCFTAFELEPYAYLKTIFTNLPEAESLEDIKGLLPWSVELL